MSVASSSQPNSTLPSTFIPLTEEERAEIAFRMTAVAPPGSRCLCSDTGIYVGGPPGRRSPDLKTFADMPKQQEGAVSVCSIDLKESRQSVQTVVAWGPGHTDMYEDVEAINDAKKLLFKPIDRSWRGDMKTTGPGHVEVHGSGRWRVMTFRPGTAAEEPSSVVRIEGKQQGKSRGGSTRSTITTRGWVRRRK